MRRAGQKRSVSARAIAAALPFSPASAIAVADATDRDELLPTAETIARARSAVSDECEARHRSREIAIRQRIETRLPGRVRNLVVRSFDAVVVLEGQCATYYTKQLAQHAAMGVLEEEHLENAIVVRVDQ